MDFSPGKTISLKDKLSFLVGKSFLKSAFSSPIDRRRIGSLIVKVFFLFQNGPKLRGFSIPHPLPFHGDGHQDKVCFIFRPSLFLHPFFPASSVPPPPPHSFSYLRWRFRGPIDRTQVLHNSPPNFSRKSIENKKKYIAWKQRPLNY